MLTRSAVVGLTKVKLDRRASRPIEGLLRIDAVFRGTGPLAFGRKTTRCASEFR
jgi:hypothetical protein